MFVINGHSFKLSTSTVLGRPQLQAWPIVISKILGAPAWFPFLACSSCALGLHKGKSETNEVQKRYGSWRVVTMVDLVVPGLEM